MNVERLFYCHLCKCTSKTVAHWLRGSFALIAHLGRQSGLASRSSYFWDCASFDEYQWGENQFLEKTPKLPDVFFPEDHQHPGCNQHGGTLEISGGGAFLVTDSGMQADKILSEFLAVPVFKTYMEILGSTESPPSDLETRKRKAVLSR